MNQPMDALPEIRYYLPHGDLVIRFNKQSDTIHDADYRPSEKTTDERLNQTDDAWSDYVAAHQLLVKRKANAAE